MTIKAPSRLILTLLFLASALPARAGLIEPVDFTTAGFVGMAAQGPFDQSVLVYSYSEFTATFGSSTAGLANPYLAPSVAGYFANGGVSLAVVRVSTVEDVTVIGVDGGTPGTRTGLQALLDMDDVSFIAIPGVATPGVQAAMIAHCEQAGDRMAILDPASPNDLNAIQVQRAGLTTTEGFAALYFPWVQASPSGTSLLLPPSGFVAGFYSASEPPDSPVGVIATVSGVAYPVSAAEQDLLNPQGINAIRDLSGIRIWGARTLASSPDWIYVATRRLGLYIEESIAQSTQWCLFEPNSFDLWAVLEQDMDDFLYGLWVQGWLQGATQNEAYFANCWLGTTMTQTDIDEGRTILQMGFAPLRPAEFIVLGVVHQRPDLTAVQDVVSTLMRLLPPTPNPFNPNTTLRFELAQDARVDLRVFDAAGRLVRTILADQWLSAGEYRRRWDGKDNGGRAVGSGVYLARLQGEGQVQLRRMVLVR